MGINVLSLFDGISCGRIALERAEIEVDNYYSSEIDKFAIKVANKNYPDNIQVGDVETLDISTLPKIDVLIGGSPCTSLSFGGKQHGLESDSFDEYIKMKDNGEEFKGESVLFWEYIRILKDLQQSNPDILFLLENVRMKTIWRDKITSILGVESVEINSSLLSAQNRWRQYWTNISGVEQPKDKGIKLKHILDDWNMMNKAAIIGRRLNAQGKREDYNKDIPIKQYIEVRGVNMDKSNCLTTVAKDNVLTFLPIGRYGDAFKDELPFRYYSITEYCRLQTVPIDYFGDIVSDSQIRKLLGNGWTVDIISHILSYIREGRC